MAWLHQDGSVLSWSSIVLREKPVLQIPLLQSMNRYPDPKTRKTAHAEETLATSMKEKETRRL
eukprot:1150007-Pelagomonas_calceolata.AAC.2